MDPTSQRAKEIFLALAGNIPAEAWENRLDEMCAGNSALRQRARALLRAHADPKSYLDQPAVDLTLDTDKSTENAERPGTVIGPYKLLEQIGEGGMGVVFMAEQTRPVQRRVALKIIKAGMDTRQVVARFEAERQALAMMDHPNIARVLDAGATDTGRPYFVMELVRGVPMTEFCNQKNLSIRDRLELFVTVCQAIQHAHQKGIIHRDIKPTNVLVTLHDGRPMIKVIDFGVAKATGQKLTDKTLFTGFTQMIGTPLYMSPEQAEMTSQDIDTRSDIFSAGVLLYELLTGTTPFDSQRLKSASFDELRRIIREEEPPRPSTRLTTIAAEAASTVCKERKSDPRQLSRLFRGELDWIVMKCLEKDRTRRYETASALAGDVERYLHDEPVQACPPSARYRFGKFARRNKWALLTAALVMVTLVLGTVVSTWQAIRASNAEADSKKEEARATTSDQRSKAALEFLTSILRSPDPARAGRTITIAEVLDRSAKELQGKFADDPLTKAELFGAIGKSYYGLGLNREAIQLLEEEIKLLKATVGAGHPDTLDRMTQLAYIYQQSGRNDVAQPMYHEAISLLEETLKLQKAKLGPDHHDSLHSMGALAFCYLCVGQSDVAIRIYEETLTRQKVQPRPDKADMGASMARLAIAYLGAGRYREAIPIAEGSLELAKATLGPNDPHTLNVINILALCYQRTGRIDEAIALFEELLELDKAVRGPDHGSTFGTMNNLYLAYLDAGLYDKAHRLAEKALTLLESQPVPKDPGSINTLGLWYSRAGRLNDALLLLDEALKLKKAETGVEDPATFEMMNDLAEAYVAADRLAEALPLFEETLKLRKVKLGPDNPDTLRSMNKLIEAYMHANRLAEAEHFARECLEIREKKLPDDWLTFGTRCLLGGILLSQNKYAAAEPLLIVGYEGLHDRAAKIPAYDKPHLKDAVQHLVQLYEATDQPEKAAEWKVKLAEFDKAATKVNPGVPKKVVPATKSPERRASLQMQKELAAVCRSAPQAIESLEFALAAPKDLVPELLGIRSRTLARGGKSQDAAAAADKLAALALTDARDLFHAATGFALCAEGVRAASPPAAPSPDAKGLEDRYAAQAVELLKKARSAGYFEDLAHRVLLEADHNLDSLRQRNDFQELLSAVEQTNQNETTQ